MDGYETTSIMLMFIGAIAAIILPATLIALFFHYYNQYKKTVNPKTLKNIKLLVLYLFTPVLYFLFAYCFSFFNLDYAKEPKEDKVIELAEFQVRETFPSLSSQNIELNNLFLVSKKENIYIYNATLQTESNSSEITFYYNLKEKSVYNLKVILPLCDDELIINQIENERIPNAINNLYLRANEYGYLYFNPLIEHKDNIGLISLLDIFTLETTDTTISCKAKADMNVSSDEYNRFICPVKYDYRTCGNGTELCLATSIDVELCNFIQNNRILKPKEESEAEDKVNETNNSDNNIEVKQEKQTTLTPKPPKPKPIKPQYKIKIPENTLKSINNSNNNTENLFFTESKNTQTEETEDLFFN